jgi:hypothetical protein
LNKSNWQSGVTAFPAKELWLRMQGLSLATVSNFLTGKPVDHASFVELCDRLALNCEEIAQLDVQFA